MKVAWCDGVPLVCEVVIMSDGERSVEIYGSKKSLWLMWEEIERLTELIQQQKGQHKITTAIEYQRRKRKGHQ